MKIICGRDSFNLQKSKELKMFSGNFKLPENEAETIFQK